MEASVVSTALNLLTSLVDDRGLERMDASTAFDIRLDSAALVARLASVGVVVFVVLELPPALH